MIVVHEDGSVADIAQSLGHKPKVKAVGFDCDGPMSSDLPGERDRPHMPLEQYKHFILPTKTHLANTPMDTWRTWLDVPFGSLFCPNASQLDVVIFILDKAGIFVASASNRIEHEPGGLSMPWYHDLVAFCQAFLPLSKEFMLANTEKVRAKLLEMRKSRGVKPGKQDTADAFCGVVICDAGEYLLWDDKEDLCAEARTTAHKARLSSRSRSFNRQHDNGELVALLLDCLSPEYICLLLDGPQIDRTIADEILFHPKFIEALRASLEQLNELSAELRKKALAQIAEQSPTLHRMIKMIDFYDRACRLDGEASMPFTASIDDLVPLLRGLYQNADTAYSACLDQAAFMSFFRNFCLDPKNKQGLKIAVTMGQILGVDMKPIAQEELVYLLTFGSDADKYCLPGSCAYELMRFLIGEEELDYFQQQVTDACVTKFKRTKELTPWAKHGTTIVDPDRVAAVVADFLAMLNEFELPSELTAFFASLSKPFFQQEGVRVLAVLSGMIQPAVEKALQHRDVNLVADKFCPRLIEILMQSLRLQKYQVHKLNPLERVFHALVSWALALSEKSGAIQASLTGLYTRIMNPVSSVDTFMQSVIDRYLSLDMQAAQTLLTTLQGQEQDVDEEAMIGLSGQERLHPIMTYLRGYCQATGNLALLDEVQHRLRQEYEEREINLRALRNILGLGTFINLVIAVGIGLSPYNLQIIPIIGEVIVLALAGGRSSKTVRARCSQFWPCINSGVDVDADEGDMAMADIDSARQRLLPQPAQPE